jgi:hypothetical protein
MKKKNKKVIEKTPNEYGIIDPEYDKCNHNIKSNKTSILFLNTKTFTVPEHIFGICKYCGKPFDYVIIDGKPQLNNEKEDN